MTVTNHNGVQNNIEQQNSISILVGAVQNDTIANFKLKRMVVHNTGANSGKYNIEKQINNNQLINHNENISQQINYNGDGYKLQKKRDTIKSMFKFN